MSPLEKTLGVLGFPLGHSLSPLMVNTALEELRLPYRLQAFEVRPDGLEDAVRGIRALGIHGVALTIPHKEAIIPFLDELSPDARRFGAVNLIERRGDRLIGHNTDGAGFVRSLREEGGIEPAGSGFLILGAGGGARGIAFELAARGASRLVIANRTLSRAVVLAESIRKTSPSVQVDAVPLDSEEVETAAPSLDAVIQCTSVGLGDYGGEGANLPLRPDCLRPEQVVVDIVYRPLFTPFIKAARARGAKVVGGLGMLVFQGAENFRIWTGAEMPIEKVRRVMEAALGGERGGGG